MELKKFFNKEFNIENANGFLDWPPNTFAITSVILKRTGAYKFIVSKAWNDEKDRFKTEYSNCISAHQSIDEWQDAIEDISQFWAEMINDTFLSGISGKEREFKGKLSKELWKCKVGKLNEIANDTWNSIITTNVTLNDLRTFNIYQEIDEFEKQESINNILTNLIKLHIISDETCTGLGLLGNVNYSSSIFRYVANMLLIATGSLSTFSKQIGIVIPKMKTPNSGLTIRSISHHLTFHTTEVEVMWRPFPWANIPQNTLNIMAVCWPDEVPNNYFKIEKDNFGQYRYFTLASPINEAEDRNKAKPFNIKKIIASLDSAKELGYDKIHTIVLPEGALTEVEFESLLIALNYHFCGEFFENENAKIPMVVSGVRRKKKVKNKRKDETREGETKEIEVNELRIALYFANKWYFLSQKKHHQWRLDKNQIIQYGLSNKLSLDRDWVEKIEIDQRRLSVIAPADWLTISPLICEDLARLEPVSEIIRGIGPSLLLALLSDGPQLTTRWSARYASVFADDPGTSVLSITSLGMVKKSKKSEDWFNVSLEGRNNIKVDGVSENNGEKVLGLWKDQISGSKDIKVLNNNSNTFILTVSSSLSEEFTADGRSDHGNSSIIQVQGIKQIHNKLLAENEKSIAEKIKLYDLLLRIKKNKYRDEEKKELKDYIIKVDKFKNELTILNKLIEKNMNYDDELKDLINRLSLYRYFIGENNLCVLPSTWDEYLKLNDLFRGSDEKSKYLDDYFQDWTDVRELSAASLAIDTLLDIEAAEEYIYSFVLGILLAEEENKITLKGSKSSLLKLNVVLDTINKSLNNPVWAGIKAKITRKLEEGYGGSGSSKKWSSPSLQEIMTHFNMGIFKKIKKLSDNQEVTRANKVWNEWYEHAIKVLERYYELKKNILKLVEYEFEQKNADADYTYISEFNPLLENINLLLNERKSEGSDGVIIIPEYIKLIKEILEIGEGFSESKSKNINAYVQKIKFLISKMESNQYCIPMNELILSKRKQAGNPDSDGKSEASNTGKYSAFRNLYVKVRMYKAYSLLILLSLHDRLDHQRRKYQRGSAIHYTKSTKDIGLNFNTNTKKRQELFTKIQIELKNLGY